MKTIKNIILVLASMYLLNACSFLDKELDTELTLKKWSLKIKSVWKIGYEYLFRYS